MLALVYSPLALLCPDYYFKGLNVWQSEVGILWHAWFHLPQPNFHEILSMYLWGSIVYSVHLSTIWLNHVVNHEKN